MHIARPALHSKTKVVVAVSWAMRTEKGILTRLNAILRCAVKKENLKPVLTDLIMVPVKYLAPSITRMDISIINISRQLNLSVKMDTLNLSKYC